jgi:hypothetical protein
MIRIAIAIVIAIVIEKNKISSFLIYKYFLLYLPERDFETIIIIDCKTYVLREFRSENSGFRIKIQIRVIFKYSNY